MGKTKVCTKCGEEKPATEEYFSKSKRGKYGIRSDCRVCGAKLALQWYNNNKEKATESGRLFKEKNREKLREYYNIYNKENKEKRAEWYKQNRKEIDARRFEYKKQWEKNSKRRKLQKKQWNNEHKEKTSEYSKKYRDKNKNKLLELRKQWGKRNRDKLNINEHRRNAKRRILPSTLSDEQWEVCKQFFDYKCSYCGMELPLEQDHFIPISREGEYTHNNIIPSCKSCNCSKGNRLFKNWYPKQCFYSKHREQKILKYLNYKNGIQQLSIL